MSTQYKHTNLQQHEEIITGMNYDLLWGAVNRNNFYFLTLFFTLLHILASTGHPQMQYTQSILKSITPTPDPF
jgi:hypothetical protein